MCAPSWFARSWQSRRAAQASPMLARVGKTKLPKKRARHACRASSFMPRQRHLCQASSFMPRQRHLCQASSFMPRQRHRVEERGFSPASRASKRSGLQAWGFAFLQKHPSCPNEIPWLHKEGFVSGHEFTRADNAFPRTQALAPALFLAVRRPQPHFPERSHLPHAHAFRGRPHRAFRSRQPGLIPSQSRPTHLSRTPRSARKMTRLRPTEEGTARCRGAARR